MIAALSSTTAVAVDDISTTKLRKAAREFEAMLLADLLKLAEHSKETKQDLSGGYDDMRIQAVAEGLAAGGGMGIAEMLVSQLGSGGQDTRPED